MKKHDLKKLALLGLTAGVMVASQGAVVADEGKDAGTFLAAGCATGKGGHCSGYKPSNNNGRDDIADATMPSAPSATQLTEDQLKSQLSDQRKQQFDNLSPEGKQQALKIAGSSCKGKNDCKGQGISKSSCAGKNSCKGQSDCKVTADDAVRIGSQNQAAKRTQSNNGY